MTEAIKTQTQTEQIWQGQRTGSCCATAAATATAADMSSLFMLDNAC